MTVCHQASETPFSFLWHRHAVCLGSALCKEQSRCPLLKNACATEASDLVIHQMPVTESTAPLLTSFLTEVILGEANKKFQNMQEEPGKSEEAAFFKQTATAKGLFF